MSLCYILFLCKFYQKLEMIITEFNFFFTLNVIIHLKLIVITSFFITTIPLQIQQKNQQLLLLKDQV